MKIKCNWTGELIEAIPWNGEVELHEYWFYLVEAGIATEAELRLVSYILGYSAETLDKVLYARTGYRSIDQLEEDQEA
jgi:hypothetical protein